MRNKTKFFYLMATVVTLCFVGILFPRESFNQKANFGYNYFYKISSVGENISLNITVLDALKRSPRALASVNSYILLDSNLFLNDQEYDIQLNDYVVEQNHLDCELYPRACAIEIPIEIIETETFVKISPDPYQARSGDTFVGVLFRFGID